MLIDIAEVVEQRVAAGAEQEVAFGTVDLALLESGYAV